MATHVRAILCTQLDNGELSLGCVVASYLGIWENGSRSSKGSILEGIYCSFRVSGFGAQVGRGKRLANGRCGNLYEDSR